MLSQYVQKSQAANLTWKVKNLGLKGPFQKKIIKGNSNESNQQLIGICMWTLLWDCLLEAKHKSMLKYFLWLENGGQWINSDCDIITASSHREFNVACHSGAAWLELGDTKWGPVQVQQGWELRFTDNVECAFRQRTLGYSVQVTGIWLVKNVVHPFHSLKYSTTYTER